jgi:hypothetical protein
MNLKPKFLGAPSATFWLCSVQSPSRQVTHWHLCPRLARRRLPPQAQAAKIPPDQLESLVAPIALYRTPCWRNLAASTYPLELIQLQRWLTKIRLKDKALADAVAKQPGIRLKPWPGCPMS